MGKYLDVVRRVVAERNAYDQNDINDKRGGFGRFGRLCRSSSPYEPGMVVLERRCPDHVEQNNWLQAVEDGRRFLGAWDEKAAVLGWTARTSLEDGIAAQVAWHRQRRAERDAASS